MKNALQDLPAAGVDSYLRLARLPVDALARIANRDGRPDWGPALIADSAEAGVKEAVGRALRNERLLTEAQLLRAKVDQLRVAGELSAAADAKRAEADRELEKERAEAASDRKTAAQQAAQQKRRVERERAEAEERVADAASDDERRADELAAKRQGVIDKAARAAEKARLTRERRALQLRQRAVAAKGRAITLAEGQAAAKSRRKSG